MVWTIITAYLFTNTSYLFDYCISTTIPHLLSVHPSYQYTLKTVHFLGCNFLVDHLLLLLRWIQIFLLIFSKICLCQVDNTPRMFWGATGMNLLNALPYIYPSQQTGEVVSPEYLINSMWELVCIDYGRFIHENILSVISPTYIFEDIPSSGRKHPKGVLGCYRHECVECPTLVYTLSDKQVKKWTRTTYSLWEYA